MLRYTFERLDEQGRVIEVKHDYQPDDSNGKVLCAWIRELFGWNLEWLLDDESENSGIIHIYMEQLDDKGHRFGSVQIF